MESPATVTTTLPPSYPRPIRHYHTLSDGRLLSYCTFTGGSTSGNKDEKLHPIVYMHGFPACGNEGAFQAHAVNKYNDTVRQQTKTTTTTCYEIYAIDRPGFGSSQILRREDCETGDAWISGVVRDVEDFLLHKQKEENWTEYSLIGVSGGGPYTLALLESYLSRSLEQSESEDDASSKKASSMLRLNHVALVAGIYCPAGVEGMMKTNQQLYQLGSNWNGPIWGTLCFYFLVFQFMMQRFLIRWLPEKWFLKLLEPLVKPLPPVDQEAMRNDAITQTFIETAKMALQQSSIQAVYEIKALFRSSYDFEDSLRQAWKNALFSSKHDKVPNSDMPKVTIHQGLLDVNVAPSHARYIYENILKNDNQDDPNPFSKLVEHPDMGHASLVTSCSKEIVASITASM